PIPITVIFSALPRSGKESVSARRDSRQSFQATRTLASIGFRVKLGGVTKTGRPAAITTSPGLATLHGQGQDDSGPKMIRSAIRAWRATNCAGSYKPPLQINSAKR